MQSRRGRSAQFIIAPDLCAPAENVLGSKKMLEVLAAYSCATPEPVNRSTDAEGHVLTRTRCR